MLTQNDCSGPSPCLDLWGFGAVWELPSLWGPLYGSGPSLVAGAQFQAVAQRSPGKQSERSPRGPHCQVSPS